jgi:hypothetical protein
VGEFADVVEGERDNTERGGVVGVVGGELAVALIRDSGVTMEGMVCTVGLNVPYVEFQARTYAERERDV